MSDETQGAGQQNDQPTDEFGDTPMHEDWPEGHPGRRARRGSMWWLGGAILIVVGIVFLIREMGVYDLENWWALFILIPAITSFAAAWRVFQQSGGRLTGPARGSLIGGIVLTMVSAFFLFGLDFGNVWPVFLILAGLAILLNLVLPS